MEQEWTTATLTIERWHYLMKAADDGGKAYRESVSSGEVAPGRLLLPALVGQKQEAGI